MGYNIYGGKKIAVARRGGLFHWMQHGTLQTATSA